MERPAPDAVSLSSQKQLAGKERKSMVVRTLIVLWVLLGSLGIGCKPAMAAEPPAPVLLILDASGSMWGQIEGENKIVIARRVLGELVDGLEAGAPVGVIAYGHRREGDCADIETVVPIAPLEPAALKGAVEALNPKGKTPITASIEAAFMVLRDRGEAGGATVILVSDGLETCGGDPCATVRAAREEGIDFVLHVVGFDVAGEDVSSLECAAQAGGGLFRSAESASELSAALEAAVALPAEVPAGRLSVKVVADGALQDAGIRVFRHGDGEEVGYGRSYASPDTNPRSVPLPDGRYRAEVTAVGIEGDVRRTFEFAIAGGAVEEREIDYSSGELSIGVTRNGELSDALYRVVVAGTEEEVAKGRTYTKAQSNPAKVRIVAGKYAVSVGSVEISGRPWVEVGEIELAAGGSVAKVHNFESGTLKVGARREGELVDAIVIVLDPTTGKAIGQGRTYTSSTSNPKTFILPPGEYRVEVREVKGETRESTVTVSAGETVERW
jgi:Ca-activated chloride channel family protein